MTEIRTGIRAISEMDTEEFFTYYAGISGSEAGLSNFGRVTEEAIEKLVELKARLKEGARAR